MCVGVGGGGSGRGAVFSTRVKGDCVSTESRNKDHCCLLLFLWW